MDFTEMVQRKIEERREGRSAAVQAAAEADAYFRIRVAPLVEAISEMVATLSDDPMFAEGVGRPEVTFKRDDKKGREGSLGFEGRVGQVLIAVDANDTLRMRIFPNFAAKSALDCGSAYEIDPPSGSLSDIPGFIVRIRDHLGDFFADLYLSPASHLLQQEQRKVAW